MNLVKLIVNQVKPVVDPKLQNDDLQEIKETVEVQTADEEPVKPRSRLTLTKAVVSKPGVPTTPEVAPETKIIAEVKQEIGHPDKVDNPVVPINKFSNNSKSR